MEYGAEYKSRDDPHTKSNGKRASDRDRADHRAITGSLDRRKWDATASGNLVALVEHLHTERMRRRRSEHHLLRPGGYGIYTWSAGLYAGDHCGHPWNSSRKQRHVH